MDHKYKKVKRKEKITLPYHTEYEVIRRTQKVTGKIKAIFQE